MTPLMMGIAAGFTMAMRLLELGANVKASSDMLGTPEECCKGCGSWMIQGLF